MGRMRESLICSILRKGSLDIPLLFVLNALFPLYGCAAVQPIVDCICMIVAIYFYKNSPPPKEGSHRPRREPSFHLTECAPRTARKRSNPFLRRRVRRKTPCAERASQAGISGRGRRAQAILKYTAGRACRIFEESLLSPKLMARICKNYHTNTPVSLTPRAARAMLNSDKGSRFPGPDGFEVEHHVDPENVFADRLGALHQGACHRQAEGCRASSFSVSGGAQ